MDAKRGRYCKHIEKRLPRVKRSAYARPTNAIERFSISQESTGHETSRDEMIKKLSDAGLSEHEVILVMERAVNRLSLEDIVHKYGWTSTGSCNYHYKETLKKLRKVGFKL